MSISSVQPVETQHSIDALNGFSPIGGQASSAGHPELTYSNVTMHGRGPLCGG